MDKHLICLTAETITKLLNRRIQFFRAYLKNNSAFELRLLRELKLHSHVEKLLIHRAVLLLIDWSDKTDEEITHSLNKLTINKHLIDDILEKLSPKLPLCEKDDTSGHISTCDQCLQELLQRTEDYENLTPLSDLI